MLVHLSVKNLALIDEVNLDFNKGFNVLTGETGAGKSIIIDAVNLVLGERADRDLIQTGKDYALVEALFDITYQPNIKRILIEYGIGLEDDDTLLLMRELSLSGKNLCRINGRIVTLSILKTISKFLVDIHGQHQHQSLLRTEHHRELLDILGGEEIAKAKSEVGRIFDTLKQTQYKIKKTSGIGMDGERRKDILNYQIKEIEEANLVDGEEEELTSERNILSNAEKITQTLDSIYENLYSGSDRHFSALDLIGKASSELGQISQFDDKLDELNERIESLLYSLEDILLEIRNFKDGFEYNPFRLDEIEGRLELIRALKRKYGTNITEILVYLGDTKVELQDLENSRELLGQLEKEEEKIFSALLDASYKLSLERQKTAKYFERQLLIQLGELGMDKSDFVVSIDPGKDISDFTSARNRLTAHGYDIVEFLISTNPGEPVKPLSKIISGGEMSRIMLAFKTILAQIDDIPTLIFDEIDAGISGRIGHVVGEKMGSISRRRQVICVTHLPQIAAMGDTHYKIQKDSVEGHTRTRVNKLDDKGRQVEIARMTSGKNITKASLEHSAELIKAAEEFKGGELPQ